jgi:hypothetical protein
MSEETHRYRIKIPRNTSRAEPKTVDAAFSKSSGSVLAEQVLLKRSLDCANRLMLHSNPKISLNTNLG